MIWLSLYESWCCKKGDLDLRFCCCCCCCWISRSELLRLFEEFEGIKDEDDELVCCCCWALLTAAVALAAMISVIDGGGRPLITIRRLFLYFF